MNVTPARNQTIFTAQEMRHIIVKQNRLSCADQKRFCKIESRPIFKALNSQGNEI